MCITFSLFNVMQSLTTLCYIAIDQLNLQSTNHHSLTKDSTIPVSSGGRTSKWPVSILRRNWRNNWRPFSRSTNCCMPTYVRSFVNAMEQTEFWKMARFQRIFLVRSFGSLTIAKESFTFNHIKLWSSWAVYGALLDCLSKSQVESAVCACWEEVLRLGSKPLESCVRLNKQIQL